MHWKTRSPVSRPLPARHFSGQAQRPVCLLFSQNPFQKQPGIWEHDRLSQHSSTPENSTETGEWDCGASNVILNHSNSWTNPPSFQSANGRAVTTPPLNTGFTLFLSASLSHRDDEGRGGARHRNESRKRSRNEMTPLSRKESSVCTQQMLEN